MLYQIEQSIFSRIGRKKVAKGNPPMTSFRLISIIKKLMLRLIPLQSVLEVVTQIGFPFLASRFRLVADVSLFLYFTNKENNKGFLALQKPQAKCYQDEEKEKKKHPTIKPKWFLFIKIYVCYHKILDCFVFFKAILLTVQAWMCR